MYRLVELLCLIFTCVIGKSCIDADVFLLEFLFTFSCTDLLGAGMPCEDDTPRMYLLEF